MISKYPCGSRDMEKFFWQWHFCLVCMWFSQLSMYLQTTDTAGTIDSVSQWPGEPTTCWLSETDDYDERIRMTDGFFMQQNLKQRRTHPSSVSIWRTNTNDKRHLGQQDFSYCWKLIIQGWAKEWSLGCVNSPPATRGSQKARFTQHRIHTYIQPIPVDHRVTWASRMIWIRCEFHASKALCFSPRGCKLSGLR